MPLQTPPCWGGRWSPPSSASAGHVQAGSILIIIIIPHPASPASCSAPRRHTSHCHHPESLRSLGVPLRALPPPSFCPCQGGLCSLWGEGRGSVSITAGPQRGRCVPTLPSHSQEHPDPAPEQLHIPPRALRGPESPGLDIPLLPVVPSSLAPRGHSLHLPVAAPEPGIYTCRRAALPWPAGRPPRWPPRCR